MPLQYEAHQECSFLVAALVAASPAVSPAKVLAVPSQAFSSTPLHIHLIFHCSLEKRGSCICLCTFLLIDLLWQLFFTPEDAKEIAASLKGSVLEECVMQLSSHCATS